MGRIGEFNPFKGNPLSHLLWKEKNTKGCYGCRFSGWDKNKKNWKCFQEEARGVKLGYPNQVDCKYFERKK